MTLNVSYEENRGSDQSNVALNESEDVVFRRSVAFKMAVMSEQYPVAYTIDRYLPFLIYVVGFLGNSISAVVWFQRRFHSNSSSSSSNSSALYLALLSTTDLAFLVLHCVDHVDKVFARHLSANAYYCEVFMYLLAVPQYLSPLFVLGFTGERFIAVCFPLHRRRLCRRRTAKTAAAAAAAAVAAVTAPQAFFWTNSPEKKFCSLRWSIVWIERAWIVFSWITEMIFFFFVPLLVFVLDLVVISFLCRFRRTGRGSRGRRREGCEEERKGDDPEARTDLGRDDSLMTRVTANVPSQTTTALLMTVSLYEVFALMPVSIIYLLYLNYLPGDPHMSVERIMKDPTWLRYFRYSAVRYVVIPLCMTRHATLVFFFLAFGTTFRQELFDLLRCNRHSVTPSNLAMSHVTPSIKASRCVTAVRTDDRVVTEVLNENAKIPLRSS